MRGKIRIRQRKGKGKDWNEWSPWFPNLFVDDGKELTLDFLFGLMSWWNPKDQDEYGGGDSGWNTVRYAGLGESMFSNASPERASGINGIASGYSCIYPVADVYLVSPEDSNLSNPVGNRVTINATRQDQTVEFTAQWEAPEDVATGTQIRELAIFLANVGPSYDPSLIDASKPHTMIARSVLQNTGYWCTGVGDPPCYMCTGVDAILCYEDDPFTIISDIELQWTFGEF